MSVSLSRRALLIRSATIAAGALLAADQGRRAKDLELSEGDTSRIPQHSVLSPVTLIASARMADGPPVRRDEFSVVGVFDVDWLADLSFAPLLDNFAASPGAFTAVRFFGSLNSGTKEKTTPTDSSQQPAVMPPKRHPQQVQSFAAAFSGFEALTTRGLIPFVQLSFFPASVSSSPIAPPASFDGWQALVRDFLDALVADPRFGLDAIRTWWFEVWNEPNIPVFWRGDFAQYLDLYRATANTVRATGYPICLGGPALAWLPATDDAAGAPLMRRFLQFLHDEPDVQCDFLSFHEKGTWVSPSHTAQRAPESEPMLGDLVSAADETARMVMAIAPERSIHLPIINNEADMNVGFDLPYKPRMTEQFPAWLTSLFVAYNDLSMRYRDTGMRFHAASDNANLQLVQGPFDGRRSVMTRATPTATSDLFKLPVYQFYELLRFIGNARGTVVTGSDLCYPNTDLFHLLTVADQQISALFSFYPTDTTTAQPRTVDYTIADIPWEQVNIARFQIDATHANAYTAAMGNQSSVLGQVIRQAQELALFAPIQQGVTLQNGTFNDRFTIAPFTTLLYWLTPFLPDIPAAPQWITATAAEGNVIVRWEPNREPMFFSYQIFAIKDGGPDTLLSPMPLRAAYWIDTGPPAGTRRYRVRAMSASGIAGAPVIRDPVTISEQ